MKNLNKENTAQLYYSTKKESLDYSLPKNLQTYTKESPNIYQRISKHLPTNLQIITKNLQTITKISKQLQKSPKITKISKHLPKNLQTSTGERISKPIPKNP